MGIQFIQHSYTTEGEPIPGVQPNVVQAAFVDPPYNIGIKYNDDPTGDKMDPGQYERFCQSTMMTISHHLKPGGTMWWLCLPAHVDFIGRLLTQVVGPRLYLVIKQETFSQYQQKTLTEDYRLLYCHQKPGGPLVFNPDAIRIPSKRQELGDKRADPRGRVPGQVWDIRRLQGTAVDRVLWHPAQVPPELPARVVAGWSNPGDLCMDGFAGSGIMAQSCLALKRDYIGFDQSATYITKMKERFKIA